MGTGAFRRAAAAAATALLCLAAAPAQAQFFWKPVDLSAPPVRGDEPGLLVPLPGATPAELRASLVWNLRAGLNVAALQCQFDPTLLTLNQYNHMLEHHRAELASSFRTLTDYFKRTNKGAKAAQAALDQYGTRTYSGFSTVGGQRSFCRTASDIGSAALFTSKGQLHQLAAARMREFRNSLKSWGEQQFRYVIPPYHGQLPNLDDRCWKKEKLRKRCGGTA